MGLVNAKKTRKSRKKTVILQTPGHTYQYDLFFSSKMRILVRLARGILRFCKVVRSFNQPEGYPLHPGGGALPSGPSDAVRKARGILAVLRSGTIFLDFHDLGGTLK